MSWRDADVPGYKYHTDRRDDPDLKAKVAKVVVARQEALTEANTLLKQAAAILTAQAGFEDGAIYGRQVQSVGSASQNLDRTTKFELGGDRGNPAENDTVLSNLAAGRLGAQILRMGDKFPL